MATQTTNYGLTKPSYNETADIGVINSNMDIIDAKMKEIDNKAGSGGGSGNTDTYGHVKVGSVTINASGDDTIELVAGSNVTLTPDTTSKSVTISATGGGGGGTSITVDSELSTTSENPVQNKVITQALNEKGTYSKPTGGIPKTDLASEVQTSLDKADNVSAIETEVDEIDNGLNSLFRYYEGVDLTQKFASEIANYSDEWAWIKARIQAGNFKGIYVCDYIPITCSNGYVLNAQVAGINTYKGYGDQQVGNHIDFICKELWNDIRAMNKVNYNNGNANSSSPFLASDLNYWLNSMSGNVPNSTSDPSVTTEVDYTTSGVLYYLPDKLKNQIITKRVLLPNRYTAGQVLTNDNSWAWKSTDKLWIPSEVEVCGTVAWGNTGYGIGGFVQYPLFACNMNRAKLRCASKDRCSWWLLSACTNNSTYFARSGDHGHCSSSIATNIWASPVCFRIG